MPKVKFLEDFEYKPVSSQTYLYMAGDIVLVTQDIANKAIEENKAELTDIQPENSQGINNTISKFKNKKSSSDKEEII